MYELACCQQAAVFCLMFAVIVLPLYNEGGVDNQAKVATLVERLRVLFNDVTKLIDKHGLRDRFRRVQPEVSTRML